MSQTDILIELDPPFCSRCAIGLGQFQVLQGRISWPGHHIQSLYLSEPQRDDARIDCFMDEQSEISSFYARLPWLPEDAESTQLIKIQAMDRQRQTALIELGSVELLKSEMKPLAPPHTLGDDPLIAICMATYQPDSDIFARQIESILCQSYANWLLIISDDASENVDWHEIDGICNLDPGRIRLLKHTQNLGFYHNFERALNYVPDNASMIAFSDQDDEWYPDKLQQLARRLQSEPDTMLVYSDMRIVSEHGELLADSYWQNRINEYRDFDSIFLNNTVTGAASLFRRELLSSVLPFPAKVGGMFHDHWLACVAMSAGKIAYIDAPLYDYYQYADSVIGHCDPGQMSVESGPERGVGRSGHQAESRFVRGQQGYQNDCLRLQLIADTLKLRFPQRSNHSTLNLMNGGVWSVIKLIKTWLKGLLLGRTRGGAELGLAMGFIARSRHQKRT